MSHQQKTANPTGGGKKPGLRMAFDSRLNMGNVSPHPQYVNNSYYHSDGYGKVTTLVQPNGFTVARYVYDPFGNMLSMSGTLAGINK
ncbi:MAG: hypothetical protein ABSE48_22825, partial [Verrucomicrobiota bacterium]